MENANAQSQMFMRWGSDNPPHQVPDSDSRSDNLLDMPENDNAPLPADTETDFTVNWQPDTAHLIRSRLDSRIARHLATLKASENDE